MKKIKRFTVLFLALSLLIATVPAENLYAAEKKPYEKICSDEEWNVQKLTNDKRLSQGLVPLGTFQSLQSAASVRAKEISTSFSHTRPDGSSCFSILKEKNIFYMSAGENIAAGQSTPSAVVSAWWNSPGHKANILGGSYKHMGVGYQKSAGGYANWVQIFAGGCETTSVAVNDADTVSVCKKGTPIADLDRHLVVTCDKHGTSYVPLTDKMCSGYQKKKSGIQKVTVRYDGKKTTFTVNVGGVKPAKPASFRVVKKSAVSVTLQWKQTKGATGYEIYRSTAKNGTYKKVKTVNKASTVKYTDKGLKAGKTYYYKVRAITKSSSGTLRGSFSNSTRVVTDKKTK